MVANYYYCYKVVGNKPGWEFISKAEWFQDQESFCYNIVLFYKRVFVYKRQCYTTGVNKAYCFNKNLQE